MIRDIVVGVRYGRGWLTGRTDVDAAEIRLDRGDRAVPASVFRGRRGGRGTLPAWVLLHGATVGGRAQAQLVRFARALAHTGAAVIVPEVPEWSALSLAPALALPTLRAAIPALRALPGVGAAPVGVVGFSFGGPHAVAAAGDPSMAGEVGRVVSFGGYCDLERTLRFLFTGEHEWRGERFAVEPDPYGRWIVGANYLTRTPGYEDAGAVAAALLTLARDAGERGTSSLDPVYDGLKRELAAGLPPRWRTLLEVFAPPAGRHPDRAAAAALAEQLLPAIRSVDPTMDPAARLAEVRVPVRLVHGSEDVLIPWSETLRMAERLRGNGDLGVTITPAFAHSDGRRGLAGALSLMGLVRRLGGVLRLE